MRFSPNVPEAVIEILPPTDHGDTAFGSLRATLLKNASLERPPIGHGRREGLLSQ